MKIARYFVSLLSTNLRASMALRGAFWTRVIFMFFNNLIYLVMWWVFFDAFDEVRGWRLKDMLAIYAVGAGVFGLSVVLGGGVNYLARTIAQGDLDTHLTQPKPPLLAAAASRSEASGLGDLATAVLLFVLCGYVTPASLPFVLVAVLSGSVVFLATAVMFHSLAFWFRDTEALSRQFLHFVLVFAIYPKTVFSGWLKIMLFTVVPAGFATFLPVDVVRKASGWYLLATILGAVVYSALAWVVFRAGMRRYESGNRFGVRV